MSCVNQCNTISYIVGETKNLTFTAKNCNVPSFTISAAEYVLMSDDEEVLTGVCQVTGHDISMLLTISETGYYDLIITYHIGAEKLKAIFTVQVN